MRPHSLLVIRLKIDPGADATPEALSSIQQQQGGARREEDRPHEDGKPVPGSERGVANIADHVADKGDDGQLLAQRQVHAHLLCGAKNAGSASWSLVQ